MSRHRSHHLLLALAGLLTGGCGTTAPSQPGKTDAYLYEDTRRLVAFVEDAATLIERRGEAAFEEFGRARSQWRTSDTYLFVYDTTGTCVWHGKNPALVGRNLISLRDGLGKPAVEMVAAVGKRPEPDASDWIFYLWEEQTDFQPTWKSSYVRKAIGPDGKVYVVGSGSSRIKIEKVFVRDNVDAAARLLRGRGREAAFRDLRQPGSRFNILGTSVFVLDAHGRSLVDPAYPTLGDRDMSGFRDAVGRPVVRELLQKLEISDAAWVQFLWAMPGERLPTRRLMYARKVEVGGETLLVGSDFNLATPIWMRL